VNAHHDLGLEPFDEMDTRILEEVAELFSATDPVPAGLTDDVKFALTVAALHADVAELQRLGAESTLARTEYTRTQTLTFSAESLSVMVTLSPMSDATVRVDGWVTGHDGVVTVEVRGPIATGSTATDADGRFVLEDVPRGLVHFVFLPSGDVRPVITPTVEI